jgi:hypothetical protein
VSDSAKKSESSDPREKMRQALEKKKAGHGSGLQGGAGGGSKVGGGQAGASTPKMFRRKSGS